MRLEGLTFVRPRMSWPKALLVGHAGSLWRFVDIRLEGCATIRADERRSGQSTDAPTPLMRQTGSIIVKPLDVNARS